MKHRSEAVHRLGLVAGAFVLSVGAACMLTPAMAAGESGSSGGGGGGSAGGGDSGGQNSNMTTCPRGQIYSQILEMVSSTPYKNGFMGWGENQVEFLGHGVGLELDELPVLTGRSGTTIREGMAIAVEPKFFFGDRGGVGVENTFVVTPEGCEILTLRPRDVERARQLLGAVVRR